MKVRNKELVRRLLNKRLKYKKNKYVNISYLLSNILVASSCANVYKIKSSVYNNKQEKCIDIINIITDTYIGISKILKEEKLIRFKNTGRYVK